MHDKHLWEFTWVRDLAILLVAVLILWLVYSIRAITAPIVVGFGLAYVFNPLLKWLHERYRVPRWAGAAGLIAALLLAASGLFMFTAPKLVAQAKALIGKLQVYVAWSFEKAKPALIEAGQKANAVAQEQLDRDMTELLEQFQNVNFTTIQNVIFKTLQIGAGALGAVGQLFGTVSYLSLAAVIVASCFFFFCWHYNEIIDWVKPMIPAAGRERTFEVARMMDQCIAAIIRGRLIQSFVMGVILSIGWGLAGVPYWLLLGMGCGLLNLVPYAAVFGWLVATVLAVIDPLSAGESFNWMFIVWPSVVYGFAQILDGWVVEPLVQGQATDLDPLTVLLVVLVGGSLAGLLGMLLAIPVAACVKILAREVILPRWREYAEST